MTTHALTTHGSRMTKCGLKVPPFIEVKPIATTWDDGDGSVTGLCIDGCFQVKPGDLPPPAAPSSPRPTGLQRFNVVAEVGSDKVSVGSAITNRDQSISLHLRSIPMGARLRLVPA